MKNAKKLLALLLAMTMLFALCACGDDSDSKKDDDKKTETSQSANADPSVQSSQNNQNNQNNTQPTTNNIQFPIGTWLLEEEDVLFTLNADGTAVLNGQNITWQVVSENSLRLVGDGDQEQVLSFINNGDSVTFITEDNEESVWVKYTGDVEEPGFEEPDIDVDGEITYDDELVAVWYGEDGTTMDLAEGGNGTIYFGDSEEYELMWGVIDDVLCLSFNDGDAYFLYEIDANELQLTAEDGDTMTFVC